MSRARLSLLSLLTVILAGCAEQPTASDEDPLMSVGSTGCAKRANVTTALLLECVTVEGVRAHQAALQAIADGAGDTRVAGSVGYNQSADYVAGVLRAAGYSVALQTFQFQAFIVLEQPLLEQVSPPPAGAIANVIMAYSGSGDVTAPVSTANNGCEAADFAGFPAGNIALLERSPCLFSEKATNAYNAGASGVVIYNNVAGGPINGTLGATFTLDIPVTSVSQDVGVLLAATPGLILHLKTSTSRGLATTSNVLAESRHGSADNVVMAGAHLDAVSAGPGINDNGSGVAALLETAVQMARVRPLNKVRFAFWGAKEFALHGSNHYVNNLSDAELNRIALYLNFDMIGSPNHVFFIFDGDDSDAIGVGPGPAGSDEIEALFEEYYSRAGVPYASTDISGGSDYDPFILAGIPAGGLFTGAAGIKTAEEESIWGGSAGDAYDPCFHLACDTFDNVNLAALDINADAVAYAIVSFAMSTERVNGIKGRSPGKSKGSFKLTGAPVAEPVTEPQDR